MMMVIFFLKKNFNNNDFIKKKLLKSYLQLIHFKRNYFFITLFTIPFVLKKIHLVLMRKKIYFSENNSFQFKKKKLFSRSIAFLLR